MAHPRKFRFGVQTTSIGSAKDWRERARKVESLGYSTLLMPDHFIDTQLAPMVGISFAAAASSQLRIGMLVLGNDFLAAITDDARGFAAAVAPRFGISPDDALGSGIALVGTVDAVCARLQQRREEWGVSYVVIGEDHFEAFAPVVARLAGA